VDDVVRQTIRVEKEKSHQTNKQSSSVGFTILPEQKYGNDGLFWIDHYFI
jgi:hypothetical protein